jgi:hypothetical protein
MGSIADRITGDGIVLERNGVGGSAIPTQIEERNKAREYDPNAS